MLSLQLAKEYANSFQEEIKEEIEKIEFVGAIRRKVQLIDVISFLVIPKYTVESLGSAIVKVASEKPYLLGGKIMSFEYIHLKINIFVARLSSYELLKFIRTGPDTFCKKACQRAKQLNLKIHADGSGIEQFDIFGKPKGWIHPKSEDDIFLCLDWPYIEPKDRI